MISNTQIKRCRIRVLRSTKYPPVSGNYFATFLCLLLLCAYVYMCIYISSH